MFSSKIIRITCCCLFTAIFAVSCNGDASDDSSCNGVACTEEFRTLNVTVVNSSQEPVALDAFRVTLVETESDLTLPYSEEALASFQRSGNYPLIDDSYVSDFERRVINLSFTGSIGEEVVVDENFTVAFDCCHVLLADGDLKVELIMN